MSKNIARFLMACAFLWTTPTLTSYKKPDIRAIYACLNASCPKSGSWNYKPEIKEAVDYALSDVTDPIAAFLKKIEVQCTDNYRKEEIKQTAKDVIEQVVSKYPYVFATFARHTLCTMGHNDDSINSFFNLWHAEHQNPQTMRQTCAHLLTQKVNKPFAFFEPNTFQPQLIRAVLKERKMCQDDYCVFYHGQQSFFGFYQDLCTKLLKACFKEGILKHRLPGDYFFVRIPQHLKDIVNKTLSPLDQGTQKSLRTDIMNGVFGYNHCLSVNGCLFGNSGNYASCTWDYVARNSNCGSYHGLDFACAMFKGLKHESLYSFFEQRIEQLEHEHKLFFPVGRLLQIAIPKNLVDECVFVTMGGAQKTSIYIDHSSLSISKATAVIDCSKQKRTAAYQDSNSSQYHFCVVMTEDMALNPWKGIKVFAYDTQPADSVEVAGEKVTYQQHQAKVEQLVSDIVSALKKSNQTH